MRSNPLNRNRFVIFRWFWPALIERGAAGCLPVASGRGSPAQNQCHEKPQAAGRKPDKPVVVLPDRSLPCFLEGVGIEPGADRNRVVERDAALKQMHEFAELAVAAAAPQFGYGGTREGVRRFGVEAAPS